MKTGGRFGASGDRVTNDELAEEALVEGLSRGVHVDELAEDTLLVDLASEVAHCSRDVASSLFMCNEPDSLLVRDTHLVEVEADYSGEVSSSLFLVSPFPLLVAAD